MTIKYAMLGSVSSGTMRTEDLLDALSYELDYQLSRQSKRFPRAAQRKLIREANSPKLTAEDAQYVVEELFEALQDFAPPYACFGAHPGDGADYGYWLSEDIEREFDGLKVDDTSEVPADYSGEVLHVNDHGNMTLYVANKGKLREIWGIV